MPENEIIPDAVIPDGVIPVEEAVPETAKEKFERERLSRRQALKKFGITSAMATFALFSVDDLARMVGKAMQQRAADNKVVEQVAKEFQQAGIVLASGDTTTFPGPVNSNCQTQGDSLPVAQRGPCCTPEAVGTWCSGYPDYKECEHCVNSVYGTDGYCNTYNDGASNQAGKAQKGYCPTQAADPA